MPPAYRLHRLGLLLIAGVLAAVPLTACTTKAKSDKLQIIAGLYPMQFLAEQIGGDRVSVTNLAQPGVEPHDLELSPKQVASVADADAVVYLSGFQPALDEAIAQTEAKTFDAAKVEPLIRTAEGPDPHVWLDPSRYAKIAEQLATTLGKADKDHAAEFTRRAAELRKQLETVDQEYRTGLAHCARKQIVASHEAYGYLAARYGLEQIAVTGLSPDTTATPQKLAEVARIARQYRVTVIFFEELVSPKVAETVATEVGAKTAVLDPIEGLQPDAEGDYLSLMRTNLATLRPALGCP